MPASALDEHSLTGRPHDASTKAASEFKREPVYSHSSEVSRI
uniref:Uncharacterized protein n=1 Tax=Arundo donax TaxID=35708 RepID=A0A0A8ZV89_ARUDO